MERRILGARGQKIWRKSGRILLSKSWDFVGGGGVRAAPPLSSPLYFSTPTPPSSCDACAISSSSSSSSSEARQRPNPSKPKSPKSFPPEFLLPPSRLVAARSLLLLVPSSTMAFTAEAQFHVLAVDDSLIDRKLIERLLRTSSYQVTTVDSGSKALEFLGLQDDQPDSPSVSPYHQEIEVNLVITDYCMPGMTGYDLLKKIKETSTLKDIPVVIMSSENVPSRINRCLEEGAEEFFLKPVQLSDMERLIPHIMKRKSTEQQKEEQQDEELEHQQQLSGQHQSDHNNLSTAINIDTGNSNSNNKRKAMDEALSPERTRPRCTVTA